MRGISEQAKQLHLKALISFSRSIELNPSLYIAYLYLIENLIELKEMDEAKGVYRLLIDQLPEEEYRQDDYFKKKLSNITKHLTK